MKPDKDTNSPIFPDFGDKNNPLWSATKMAYIAGSLDTMKRIMVYVRDGLTVMEAFKKVTEEIDLAAKNL